MEVDHNVERKKLQLPRTQPQHGPCLHSLTLNIAITLVQRFYVAETLVVNTFVLSKPTNGLMEHFVNGIHDVNGHSTVVLGLDGEPSQEELERELPSVEDGQVPLGEVLSRMVQAIYSELTEMAETLVLTATIFYR